MKPLAADVHYQIEVLDLHAHLWRVTLTIAQPFALQILQLPVWIPGSYMVREFSKQLSLLKASQLGRECAVTQTAKAAWQVQADASTPLTLHYQVHAYDASVRTAWLDALRGFFNPTSLCLIAAGHEQQTHSLHISQPAQCPHWRLATALQPLKTAANGFGLYSAAGYDELADSPVEMAGFWSGSLVARGVPHTVVVTGAAPSFDGARLLADTRRICETEIHFWHGKGKAVHDRYVFLINAVADGYGGLEHRHSTALICKREDLPRVDQSLHSDGYVSLLGLISHEYFHTWNVKRLRPVSLASYDYSQENYTDLLWFFEGITSYYDDVLLCRAELISPAVYLKLLAKTINNVLQTPGRKKHSVAQASFEAWTKLYRPDANSPNLSVSYYAKGTLVGLCLDLSLRQSGHSLDEVMRGLWKRCKAGPMQEDDLLQVLKDITGRSWQRDIKTWVHGTADLPLREMLTAQGVDIAEDKAALAQQLGLRVQENHAIQVQTVLNGSAAELAGFAPGDEWLGVTVAAQSTTADSWRIKRIDQLPGLLGRHKTFTALVARDGQLLQLPVRLPAKTQQTWRLGIRDPVKVGQWLAGNSAL
ncbi:MAG: M61 family peptidase [Limnohabitans sp.]|nr:M61 family peptidase [Limnohabitans sp.]